MLKKIRTRFMWTAASLRSFAVDLVLLVISIFAGLWLRTDSASFAQHLPALNNWAPIFTGIQMACLIGFGVYRSLWRYVSIPDVFRITKAVFLAMLLMISSTYVYPTLGYIPRSTFFIDAFMAILALVAVRLARRTLYEHGKKQESSESLSRILIYGAGSAGRMLAERLRSNSEPVQICGFIDDDRTKVKKVIAGIPVLGTSEDLEKLLEETGATDLVVAIRTPRQEILRQMVVFSRKYNVRPQILSSFQAKGFQPRNVSPYRELELGDLLTRPTAQIDVQSVREILANKVVLVTGAGGSIGAELSRQVARLGPAKLLLLDHSEYNLYEIDSELRPSTRDFDKVIPLLADIKDKVTLRNLFEQHKPHVVFHAAAYKHVHLVEANVPAAVLNNVVGTQNLIELSEAFGVERFVMISTDKAVNPVGSMGATKRVCELLTSAAGVRTQKPYSSVRFGNVLGSSGSLIPLLKKQIAEGGPVTLTHPDMTRYFMLIPEAVSLVLMSATLSRPGDINVLKMGESVRILDIAKSLIALMGKKEDEVSIVFTGVRPGEKMFEELYLTGDELTTLHPDILTAPFGDGSGLGEHQLMMMVNHLVDLSESADPKTLEYLLALANFKSKPLSVTGVALGEAQKIDQGVL